MFKHPTIIIPGAQRSGTSTLYEVLIRHSRIAHPLKKENQFFALDRNTVKSNLDWYKKQFPDKTLLNIDASTFYLQTSWAPELIKKYLKDVKILIILRDPVKRAFSGYQFMKHRYPQAEYRSFHNILNSLEGPTSQQVIFSENRALKRAIMDLKIRPNFLNENIHITRYKADFKSSFEDYFWVYKYFQTSIYSEKVEHFEKIFGSCVKIIVFEKLLKNASETLKEIMAFLGLEYEDTFNDVPKRNRTVSSKNPVLKSLLMILHKTSLGRLLTKFMDKEGLNWIKEGIYRKHLRPTPISENQYNWAKNTLQNEYQYWINRDKTIERLWKY